MNAKITKGETVNLADRLWTVKKVGKVTCVLSADGRQDQKFPTIALLVKMGKVS